ncbi:MAG: flagellar filament capping protein FliD [Acidobacteria bacterium]|nr:flagellar filament capping protein FliD [Acidobacteriota bacterium]
MAGAMGIDGLASGLDTTSIINSLIGVDSLPQTQLKTKVSEDSTLITALQALNSKFQNLQTTSANNAKTNGLTVFKASTSNTSVTTNASSTATPTNFSITVDKLAQSQSMVSAPMTSWPDNPPTLTIAGANGISTTITAATTSLDDVVSAINKSSSGVTAVKISSGTDASGTPQYRLQINGGTTGAKGAFTVYRGDAAAVAGGTATSLTADPLSATISTAQDASIRLWAGTSAQQTVTSATNTFDSLAVGVSLTVSAVSATPVDVTVARDTSAVSTKASDLVSQLNAIFAAVKQQQSTSSSTDPSTGKSTLTAGALTGDSNVTSANDQLYTAAAAPVNGQSPATIGINTTKDGNLVFDAEAFSAAYTKDPSTVTNFLQTISSRVATVAATVSDPYTGTITSEIKGQQSEVKDLSQQISDWDTKLATMRSNYRSIYSALEVTLSGLKSQQSWLTGQISSLPTYGSSSK